MVTKHDPSTILEKTSRNDMSLFIKKGSSNFLKNIFVTFLHIEKKIRNAKKYLVYIEK